jgi:hypothetical protein
VFASVEETMFQTPSSHQLTTTTKSLSNQSKQESKEEGREKKERSLMEEGALSRLCGAFYFPDFLQHAGVDATRLFELVREPLLFKKRRRCEF